MPLRKHAVADLALFGGAVTFAERLVVGRPNIVERTRFHALVDEAFDRRQLSNRGPLVRRMEALLADRTGARECIVVNNATIALQVVAHALNLTGEVIIPAFTFAATAQSLLWIGLKPVLCDVLPETHQLDPIQAERLITSRTSAILGVHLWGEPCSIRPLEQLAQRHGLHLFFDAAHAFGCSYGGRFVGSFGAAEVLSFHATKFVNSFEGGAICTDDSVLAAKARRLISFGFGEEHAIVDVGTNGKMCEPAAAMGIVGLENFEVIAAANRSRYDEYRRGLQNIPGLRFVCPESAESRNRQYVVVEIDETACGITRDQVHAVLSAENVQAAKYFSPGLQHASPLLFGDLDGCAMRFPTTERLCRQVMQLPTGLGIELTEVADVCALIRFAIQHGREIASRLNIKQAVPDAVTSAGTGLLIAGVETPA